MPDATTSVNGQITDAITQTNVKVLGEASAMVREKVMVESDQVGSSSRTASGELEAVRAEAQFVLRPVTSKESASWRLVEDDENGLTWQIDIPFPGSGGVPWIVQRFPLSPCMAREIVDWLRARLGEPKAE